MCNSLACCCASSPPPLSLGDKGLTDCLVHTGFHLFSGFPVFFWRRTHMWGGRQHSGLVTRKPQLSQHYIHEFWRKLELHIILNSRSTSICHLKHIDFFFFLSVAFISCYLILHHTLFVLSPRKALKSVYPVQEWLLLLVSNFLDNLSQ